MIDTRFLCILICAGIAIGAPLRSAAQERLSPGQRTQLADEMRESLTEKLIDVWYPLAVDEEYGGYLSTFDHEWSLDGPQDKMIVTQARHVWTLARAAQFLPSRSDLMPQAAHGYAFLQDVMWDDEYGGFFWLVERDGTVRSEPGGQLIKQAYGVAFAIYGLAAYHDVSRDPEALELAIDAFRWLDEHAHDPVHGGYINYMERDGTPMREGFRDTPPKDQNSSIHILEAFTELYHVWPDPLLADRLEEMLALIRDTLTVEPGYLTLFTTADWTPISYRDSTDASREENHYFDHVSFGHDVETAYLMLEASDALGLRDDSTIAVGKQMVDHALNYGWDVDVGGFYDAGYYFREDDELTVTRDTKNWWAQAEGLNTLLLFGDRFPLDSQAYHDKAIVLWEYINAYLIDHENGGWYEGGLDKEPDRRTGRKGHIWKAAYHNGRALMNSIRLLEAGQE